MSAEEALAQRLDELQAITSIYPDESHALEDGSGLEIFVPSASHPRHLIFRFYFPSEYPTTVPPLVEAQASHLDLKLLVKLEKDIQEHWIPGEPSLFTMISWIMESQEHLWEIGRPHDVSKEGEGDVEDGLEDHEAIAARRAAERAASGPSAACSASQEEADLIQRLIRPRVVHGEPFTERKSTFQAHLCPVTSTEEVKLFMTYLLHFAPGANKIRNATHNISAYRFHCPAKNNSLIQDCDDDGEEAAGGRLLHLLQVAQVSGVAVVVSRWFGGVLLGPSRFSLINNTARALLEREGYIKKK